MAFSYSKKPASGKWSGLKTEKRQNNWPNIGISINELRNLSSIRVFVDSTFINTPGFYGFVKMWQLAGVSGSAQRYYYIHADDISKISQEYRFLLSADDYKECASWQDGAEDALHNNIVLLTTDVEAAQEAWKAARNAGCYLRWYNMDKNGKLVPVYSQKEMSIVRESSTIHEQESNNVNQTRRFSITQKMVPIKISDRYPGRVPGKGNQVKCNHCGRMMLLGKPVMTDHISITYETDWKGYFAKIYTREALTIDLLQKKAEKMLQIKVEIPGICWPKDILMDQNGCFTGILVPESKGVQLVHSVFAGATGLETYFPEWNKQDLCILTNTILNVIYKLHNIGILFGCLNPASIYVEGKESIYFVDTDNWQIEGYPSLSQNQTFTPPELLDKNEGVYLYNLDQDNYQVAVLTFMLMMPGKFPYARGKTGNERDSIAKKIFPFSVGGDMRRTRDAQRPSGVWRIVWDHLPYHMCEAFYETFHVSGKYSIPGKRLSESVWIRLVREFNRTLLSDERADSRGMFPRTFRRDGKRTFVTCSECGQEHPDFYFIHNLVVKGEKIDLWQRGYRVCIPCANGQSDMFFDCQSCGKRFYYTNRTKILHQIGKSEFDFKNQRWCKDCKKRTMRCGKCGKEVPVYQIREFEDRKRNQRINVCRDCFGELIDEVQREKKSYSGSFHLFKSRKRF